jgi:ABC-type Zn uptake system ZnuABC Zn-binding protein ZnuA
VVVTDGIPLLKAGEHADERQPAAKPGEAKPDNDRASGEYDPHVWHDVRHTMQMTGRIRDALIQADAANADAYRANADSLLKDLAALDAWVAEQVGRLPADRRKLITTHDTFGYFAARYGFTIIVTALGSVTTEAGEPSAGEFAQLVGEIKAAGVPAIFAENVSNPKLMERLAREAGVALGPPLYTTRSARPAATATAT